MCMCPRSGYPDFAKLRITSYNVCYTKLLRKWVDNPSQKKILTSLGVDYLQGFGISKALDENELIEHYNKGLK